MQVAFLFEEKAAGKIGDAFVIEFGTRISGVSYFDRPGAYAIIQDESNAIALVRTQQGFLLPGGGIEPTEGIVGALQREILEELGYQSTIGELSGAIFSTINLRFPAHVPGVINIDDPTNYTFTKTVLADDDVRALDLEGSVSLARHYLFGSHFGSFEVGGKVRNGNKKNRTNEPVYVATRAPALTYDQVLGNAPKDPNFYSGDYTLPPFSDYNKILALLAANPAAITLDVNATHSRSDPNDYHTTERVYAGYVMNSLSFGRARIQTGIRIETTQSNFLGYHVTFDSNGTMSRLIP